MLSARLQLQLSTNETQAKLKLSLTPEELVNCSFYFFLSWPSFFFFFLVHRALLFCFSITQFYAITVDELIL